MLGVYTLFGRRLHEAVGLGYARSSRYTLYGQLLPSLANNLQIPGRMGDDGVARICLSPNEPLTCLSQVQRADHLPRRLFMF